MDFEPIAARDVARERPLAPQARHGGPPRFQSHRFAPDIERELKALSKPRLGRSIAAAMEDWVLIGLSGGVVVFGAKHIGQGVGVPLMLGGWLLIGARMRALATLLHESAHRSLARQRMLNALLGSLVSGWWIVQLRGRYVRSHVHQHHPCLGDPDRDPDVRHYVEQRLLDSTPSDIVADHLIIALSGAKTIVNLPYLLRDRLLPEPGARLTSAEVLEIVGFVSAWAGLATILSLNGWWLGFLLIWVVPYLTTFQAINWLIEVSEHFPLVWTRGDPFTHTRNRKGPALERFFTGAHGESWHRVHHERPGIPFWNLRRAHEVMMRDPDYAAFERESGGLLVRGPKGEPSIIDTMRRELRRYRAGRVAGQAST